MPEGRHRMAPEMVYLCSNVSQLFWLHGELNVVSFVLTLCSCIESIRYGENGTISLAGLKRLLQKVGLGRVRAITVQHHEQPGHHHHHHHQYHVHHDTTHHHKHGDVSPTKFPTNQDGTPGKKSANLDGHDKKTTICLNASSILSSHGMSQGVGITLKDFSFLCPALLNQIDRGACIMDGDAPEHEHRGHKHHTHDHNHHGDHNHSGHGERSAGENAWVGGFLSITIISLLSLFGVVLIPLMNKVFFKFLLSFLVALAVGTLSGDAFLHLIPHDAGLNMHGHNHNDEHEENLDAVWKGLTALSGVYFMFLIEHFLTLGKMYKDKKQKVRDSAEKQSALEENDMKPNVETNGAGAFADHSSSLHGGSVAEEEQVMLAPQVSVDCENKCHSHFHDTVGQADSMHHHHHDYHHILHHHHSQNHHPHSHSHSYSEQHFQEAGVATLAWMVIMGDGLHNFSDGLAIGEYVTLFYKKSKNSAKEFPKFLKISFTIQLYLNADIHVTHRFECFDVASDFNMTVSCLSFQVWVFYSVLMCFCRCCLQ
uniref:Zinc transporter ZIP6 n=1 Tax=Acanthochromis polyacanthus TaxID=80966 RepID=A0A3Q1GC43_9TELE